MKCLKHNSIKRLGEDVSILTFSRDIYSRHIIFLSTRSLMKWYLISMFLVLECWTGFLEISRALELSTTSSSNIFYLCSRQRHKILLFTHPSNNIGSYIKTPTGGAFSIIAIVDLVWIWESSKRQIWLFAIKQSIITNSTNIFYDSFNSIQMWNLRIRLKPRTYTDTESNIRTTCS